MVAQYVAKFPVTCHTFFRYIRLNISNALAENAIRLFVVGRRNWLFSDTPRGARSSATDLLLNYAFRYSY